MPEVLYDQKLEAEAGGTCPYDEKPCEFSPRPRVVRPRVFLEPPDLRTERIRIAGVWYAHRSFGKTGWVPADDL